MRQAIYAKQLVSARMLEENDVDMEFRRVLFRSAIRVDALADQAWRPPLLRSNSYNVALIEESLAFHHLAWIFYASVS